MKVLIVLANTASKMNTQHQSLRRWDLTPKAKSNGTTPLAFTLVEVVIALTILIILAAGAVPIFKGWQDEQLARQPVVELVRLTKEARMRAMREKRPYQIAFYPGGFIASRYFSPYLQIADLTEFMEQAASGNFRLNPNADDADSDLDAGAGEKPKTQLPLAPSVPKRDDNWSERYDLPTNTTYRLQFWNEFQPTEITGDIVKLWVFQPTGICIPLKLHLERESTIFDVEFNALTADITREVIAIR